MSLKELRDPRALENGIGDFEQADRLLVKIVYDVLCAAVQCKRRCSESDAAVVLF